MEVNKKAEQLKNKNNEVSADVNNSSIGVKLSNALFLEYNKAYSNTKAGEIYPKWFSDEQLKWIVTVFEKQ